MSTDAERQAILTRAAICESARQLAEQRGDRLALDGLTVELAQLRSRYTDLLAQPSGIHSAAHEAAT